MDEQMDIFGQMEIVGTQVTPVARTSDPVTSHAAAASIPSDRIRKRQRAVLLILKAAGPSTDEQIALRYALVETSEAGHFPPQSPSGLRTRRSELHRAGYVKDAGEKRKLKSGRLGIVWEASDEA